MVLGILISCYFWLKSNQQKKCIGFFLIQNVLVPKEKFFISEQKDCNYNNCKKEELFNFTKRTVKIAQIKSVKNILALNKLLWNERVTVLGNEELFENIFG